MEYKIKKILNFIFAIAILSLPVIWVWDVWDDVNEGIITRVYGSEMIIILSSALLYAVIKYGKDD